MLKQTNPDDYYSKLAERQDLGKKNYLEYRIIRKDFFSKSGRLMSVTSLRSYGSYFIKST